MPMAPGEVTRRFVDDFTIEQIGGTDHPNMRRLIPGEAAYVMTRRKREEDTDS